MDGQDKASLLSALRELLYEEPSALLWGDVWGLFQQHEDLEEADDAGWEAVIDYALAHLAHWPVEQRKIRFQASSQWRGKSPPPQLSLARHVEFTIGEQSIDELIEWCASPWCRTVDTLHLTTDARREGVVLTMQSIEALLGSPALAQIKRLSLTSLRVPAAPLEALFHHARMAHLEQLSMRYTGLEQRGASILARSPYLGGLTALDLCHNALTGDALYALLQLPCLPQLKAFLLQDNKITDDGVEALSRAPFARLETLFLGQNRLWAGGLFSLARATQLATLKHLDLRRVLLNRGGSNMLEALGVMPHLKGLERLGLCGAAPDVDDLMRFASEVEFPALTALDLSENAFGQRGLVALLQGRMCERLTSLELRSCQLDSDAIEALAGHPLLGQIEHVGLGINPIGADAIAALLASASWRGQLRSLDLGHTRGADVSADAGNQIAQVIASAPSVHSLEVLDVSGNDIRWQGLRALLHSPSLARLQCLEFSSNTFALASETESPVQVQAQFLEALSSSSLLQGLQVLRMEGLRINLDALLALLASPLLGQLLTLHAGFVAGSLTGTDFVASSLADADAMIDGVWPPRLNDFRTVFGTSADDILHIPYDWPEDAENRLLMRSDLVHLSKVDFYNGAPSR